MKQEPLNKAYPAKVLSRTGGKVKAASLAAAMLGWLLLSVLTFFILWAMHDRERLIRDNDNERTLNTLFAELRNFSDLGSAIESNPVLYERIKGAAIYGNDLQPVQQWGKTPPVFDEKILEKLPANKFGRYTIPDRQGRSAKFIIRFERMGMPRQREAPGQLQTERPFIPRQERRQTEIRPGGEQGLLFSGLARGRYFYTDISHTAYWRARSVTMALFPLVEIIIMFLVLGIRFLYLRNREYRGKIEAQQNLVVLGTAAGTLAHEIKNPLLSIRLQTGILEKTNGDRGSNEIKIINQEVERLSSLVYRVNDYLREPAGSGSALNISALIAETAPRIFGIEMPPAASAMIFADEERIRSVLENVMRNAIESGSPVQDINITVETCENTVTIRVCDRGQGIDEKDIKRIFDPFYTSKSTGTGIGLAVSKRFTEAAGGKITAENRKDGGLMVTLVFPQYSGES